MPKNTQKFGPGFKSTEEAQEEKDPRSQLESQNCSNPTPKSTGIEFLDDLPSSEWPSCHRKTIEEIRDLGQRKFESYVPEIDDVDDTEPWKLRVKYQAELLAQKVQRQRYRNESSWRYACEHIVFARMEAEVAW